MAYTLEYIAQKIGAKLEVENKNRTAESIAALNHANSRQISFLSDKKHAKYLKTTNALAVILKPADREKFAGGKFIMDDPHLGFARAANLLLPAKKFTPQIHPSAAVANSALIDKQVFIGANVVIGENSHIASGVFIGAGAVIGDNCRVGANTWLFANVTVIDGSSIGENCIIHAGAVIGDDGFGFADDNGKWLKIPQTGRVVIGDYVEIGSSAAIDRGALGDTIIKNGVKIDNLVHIGHNVIIGENTAIAALTGFAGSSTIGKNCQFGGMAAVSGHLAIADDCIILGKSTVTKTIRASGVYSSVWPAEKASEWRKMVGRFRRIKHLWEKRK